MLFGCYCRLVISMCDRARQDSLLWMRQQAAEMGANAVIGMRYDATVIVGGVSEVLAYGTAVVVERDGGPYR